MKTAIIGSGISGLAAASELSSKNHQITVYEANDYIGGHVQTIRLPVDQDGLKKETKHFPVELGVFMLDPKYIHPTIGLKAKELGLKLREFPLTFSFVSQKYNFSWSTQSQFSGILKKLSILLGSINNNFGKSELSKEIRFFIDLDRFFRHLPNIIESESYRHMSVFEFIQEESLSQHFLDSWLFPQMMCWWGITKEYAMSIDIQVIAQSFYLVSIAPQYIFEDGWDQFIQRLSEPFIHNIKMEHPVDHVVRKNGKIDVSSKGCTESYENVIFAVPPKVVLNLLQEKIPEEENILKTFQTTSTKIYLHKDTDWLPSDNNWSTINLIQDHRGNFCSVFYGILDSRKPNYILTWGENLKETFRPTKIIMDTELLRTLPTVEYTKACRKIHSIQGIGGIWHCGAHVDALTNGNNYAVPSLWHENSFKSGIAAANKVLNNSKQV